MMLLAASLAAIALLVALAWGLGFRRRPNLADADEARRIADAALYGFSAIEVMLDDDAHGATLRGGDGASVRIAALGDRWVVRRT